MLAPRWRHQVKRAILCVDALHEGTREAPMRRLEEDHGQAVSERLVQAMNAHDLEAHVACFRDDYRSEQPAHPARTFTGREQVRQN